jgi:transposase
MDPEGSNPRVKGINRNQLILRPMNIDQLVAEDHPVRAIWELVGRLNLEGFYKEIEAVEGVAGRSAWDPQLLISLWIFAYSEGVGSAREVCRLCEYHPAYQWLTAMQVVNYHTLSDFRVAHGGALQELFIEVLGVLSSEDLITMQRVMHDGTKIKACASADTFRREGRIQAHLELAREQVKILEEAQEEEVSARESKAKQRAAREKQNRLELALQELEKVRAGKTNEEERAQARVSLTDPQARIMKQGDGGFAPSYNVQISTDAAAGIIVGVGISQSASDCVELGGAVDRLEETMARKPDQVIVDGGYITRENILAMEERGVDLVGPTGNGVNETEGQMARRGIDLDFQPEAFTYDSGSNTYTCPAGKVLKYGSKETLIGRTKYKYHARAADCQSCPFKSKCCPKAASGRAIVRSENHPVVTAFIQRMQTEEAKNLYKQRGAVGEFPNAWIKSKIGLRQFRLRGLEKVGLETLWACLTHNIQQWIRLSWRVRMAT